MERDGDSTEQSEDLSAREVNKQWVLRGVLPGDDVHVVLRGQSFILGRGDDAGVKITRSRISRRHAELYRQGPIFALRDLGSTNGTHVNGKRVEHCAVRPGMLLRIGDWLGLVEEATDSPNTPFKELLPGLFGGDALASSLRTVSQAASSNLPLELVGETGTGKELLARAFHNYSRRSGAFHAVNCAALSATLAEGELFGYRRGAFTGAERPHVGQIRAAHGGTLFLDEVAELSLDLQAKLLRALERKEVTPLGETQSVSVDVRVVVAAQTHLHALVRAGGFRADLAARLSGMTVRLPAARERVSDIPSLFVEFLRKYARDVCPDVTTKVHEALCLYQWPANVRELDTLAQNLLARFPDEACLHRHQLPVHLQVTEDNDARSKPGHEPESRSAHDLKKFETALEKVGGNVKAAAEMAGISRQRAYRLMTPVSERKGEKRS